MSLLFIMYIQIYFKFKKCYWKNGLNIGCLAFFERCSYAIGLYREVRGRFMDVFQIYIYITPVNVTDMYTQKFVHIDPSLLKWESSNIQTVVHVFVLV